MKRREFIAGLGSAAAWPRVAPAQQRLPIVGMLYEWADKDYVNPILRGMSDAGFIDGRNVVLEYRDAAGDVERLPGLAAELVGRKPAVIVAGGTNSALAVKAATRDIPVIFAIGINPVELGFVVSLNRPGGNLTGHASLTPQLTEKRLDLLHKLVPSADVIAMLVGSAHLPVDQAETRDLPSVGRALGVRVLRLNANTESEIAAAFARLVEQKAGALLVGSSNQLFAHKELMIALAARYSVPTMFLWSSSVESGGLLSYGPDFDDSYRQLGIYVARIIRGEKPADLPVLQTTRFKLFINLRTAKAQNFEIPPPVLALADQVIE